MYARITGTGQLPAGKGADQRTIWKRWSRPPTNGSRERTGIEERHIAAPGETTCDLAEQAARAPGGGRHRSRTSI
jgi:3-oxoacyl-[acyl-carrier-protein] synthase III